MRSKKCNTNLLRLAVIGALGTGTTAAYAQLEEVLVTAQKRAQTANDVGMSISAFSGDALQELGVVGTSDLASITPGFTFTDTGSGVPSYNLRGVGYNDRSYTAQSAVTLYVDEIAIPYPVMTNGALLDLERVEILKGPQGTLYGRNTTGGAINYIAAKPTEEFEAGIVGSFGNYDTYELQGYVGGPLGDNFRSRLAVRTLQSGEGWQENNLNGDTHNERDATSLRLSLAGDFTNRFRALLQLNWWEEQSDTQAPQYVKLAPQAASNAAVIDVLAPWTAAAEGGDDPERAGWTFGQDLAYDMTTASLALRLNYDLSDAVELVSLTGYSEFEDTGSLFDRSGFSGVPFDDVASHMTYLDLMGGGEILPYTDSAAYPWAPNQLYGNEAEIEFFSQELRLVGSLTDINWVAGLYYSEDSNDTTVKQQTVFSTNTNIRSGVPFLNFLGVNTIAEQDSSTMGAYGHVEWDVSDTLRLTLGGRYSDDEIDFKGCSADPGEGSLEAFFFNVTALTGNELWFPPGFDERGCGTILTNDQGAPIANGDVSKKLEEDSVSYKLALDWSVTEDVMVYGSYSRGFKAGQFPNLAANYDVQYEPTEQEQLDAFELGVKAGLLAGDMQLNVSMYHYVYQDKQLLGSFPTEFGVLRTLTNVPDATVNGAELDLQWQPAALEGLYLQLSGSYIDSEVDEYSGPNVYGEDQVFDGSPFPFTAELQFSAMMNYRWSLSDRLDAFVGADASYSDEINTDFEPVNGAIDPDFVMGSYTVWGARFGVAAPDDRWRATVWGRNLGDEYYTTNVLKSVDAVMRFTGMPLTYGVTLEYSWW